MRSIVIEEIKRLDEDIEELSELLKTVVNDGASQLVFYLHWNKKKQQIIGKLY
ncbi:acetyltransferase GNAT family [Bacillus cereus]|nr:acetyltransferase GNAT family [Bacillus cereus]